MTDYTFFYDGPDIVSKIADLEAKILIDLVLKKLYVGSSINGSVITVTFSTSLDRYGYLILKKLFKIACDNDGSELDDRSTIFSENPNNQIRRSFLVDDVPTNANDAESGYSIGSLATTDTSAFLCLDDGENKAKWLRLGSTEKPNYRLDARDGCPTVWQDSVGEYGIEFGVGIPGPSLETVTSDNTLFTKAYLFDTVGAQIFAYSKDYTVTGNTGLFGPTGINLIGSVGNTGQSFISQYSDGATEYRAYPLRRNLIDDHCIAVYPTGTTPTPSTTEDVLFLKSINSGIEGLGITGAGVTAVLEYHFDSNNLFVAGTSILIAEITSFAVDTMVITAYDVDGNQVGNILTVPEDDVTRVILGNWELARIGSLNVASNNITVFGIYYEAFGTTSAIAKITVEDNDTGDSEKPDPLGAVLGVPFTDTAFDSADSNPNLDKSNMSISLWFRPQDNIGVAGDQVIWETGGSGSGAAISLNENILSFDVQSDFSTTLHLSVDLSTVDLSGTDINDDFIHVVVSIDIEDTKQIRLYVNGKEYDSGYLWGNMWTGSNPSAFGTFALQTVGRIIGTATTFDGYIANFCMYEKVLSSEEVSELFSSQLIASDFGNTPSISLGSGAQAGTAELAIRLGDSAITELKTNLNVSTTPRSTLIGYLDVQLGITGCHIPLYV